MVSVGGRLSRTCFSGTMPGFHSVQSLSGRARARNTCEVVGAAVVAAVYCLALSSATSQSVPPKAAVISRSATPSREAPD